MLKKTLIALLFLLSSSGPALAMEDYTAAGVEKAKQTLSSGKEKYVALDAKTSARFIEIFSGGYGNYRIDLNAQLCFFEAGGSYVSVPCENVAKGYPLVKPLMAWVK